MRSEGRARGLDGISAQMRTLVFGLVALVLLAGVAGIVGVGLATHTVHRLGDDLFPTFDANADVLQDVADADVSIRAWVATEDTAELAPYHAARRRLPRDQARLAQLTAADPELRRLAASQRQAIHAWLSGYVATRRHRPPGVDNIDLNLLATGRAQFARIRTVNRVIAATVDAQTTAASRSSSRDLPWAFAVLVLVALVGGGGFLVAGRIAARISRPLEDMQRVVDGWADGRQDARAVPAGPREVRKVAYALNNFADENARVRELEQQVVDRVTDLDRAKSDFLSTVSHELRTPLTSIAGYVELLEEDLEGRLDPQQASMMGVVKRNVVRLRGLIEDLLTLSRTESEPFRTSFDVLDLTHLTSDVAYDLQTMAAARGITINEVHPPRALVMRGDASQLSRALLNLVSNAVKFSPDGGDVTIRVKHVREWAHLEVTDHGIGISAAEMPNLATRFFRASNAVTAEITGTGLGLRIVQAIVDNHGGRLEMESVEGEGTTARMVLPLVSAGDAAGKKTGAAAVEEGVGSGVD
ncbi:MAG: sensor histidine kinase [Nocardioidaceae bacterium]